MNPIDILSLVRSLRGVAVLALLMLAAACGGGGGASTRSSPPPGASATPGGATGAPATAPTTASAGTGVVSWVHIGDLHIQTADMQNYKDLQTILGEVNQDFAPGVSFAVLPGDNANDGADSEYQLIGQAIKAAALKVPLYAVKGDHDLKSTSQAFNQYLAPKSYYSEDVNGYHFIFLDAMGSSGANSLTAGSTEFSWFSADLKAASAAGQKSVIVMHPYFLSQLPDLTDFQSLVQQNHVIMIDSGHTHTNDLANDGHIVFAATRSTGQDTEGSVGVSISTIDHGIVSWKFAPLGSFPFVEITSPGDSALITSAAGIAHGIQAVDAKAFSNSPIASASYQVDGGAQTSMKAAGSDLWTAGWDTTAVPAGQHKITVTVKDAAGRTATDNILAEVNQADTYSAGSKAFGPASNLLLATNADIAAKGIVTTTASGGAGGGGGGPKGGGPKGGPAGGTATVTAVGGGQLKLKLADGSTATVALGTGVRLLKQSAATSADLAAGDTIQLVGPPSAPTAVVIVASTAHPAAWLQSPPLWALGTGLVMALLVGAGAGMALGRRERAIRGDTSGGHV